MERECAGCGQRAHHYDPETGTHPLTECYVALITNLRDDIKRLENILCWVRDDMEASGEGTDEAFEMILHGLKGGSADV